MGRRSVARYKDGLKSVMRRLDGGWDRAGPVRADTAVLTPAMLHRLSVFRSIGVGKCLYIWIYMTVCVIMQCVTHTIIHTHATLLNSID